MLTLDPNWVGGSPIDPTTLPEVVDRVNTHGRPVYIPMQARPEYYNYKNSLRIPFDKIPSTTQAVPVGAPYGTQGVPVGRPYGTGVTVPPGNYPVVEAAPRNYPIVEATPKNYPVVESPKRLPASVSPKVISPSKFGWLRAGGKLLGPVGMAATVGDLSYMTGGAINDYFGISDKLIGNAGKADLSKYTRSAEVIKTPGQGSTYNGEISDAEFDSMSHQEKLNWLADRNQYRREAAAAAAYVPASPTATNEYGEGKAPNGNIILGSEAPVDAMLPDGTMVHDGVTVAPTAPTVDNLIATANKPRVANRVANRPQVTTPTAPTFNYGGSAPTYASSYNLNRDPNYQYSEAYAWRNNPAPTPTPTPWNNGWAKPNPRASSITNYYAGIGY